jgi:hypothetical protein
MTKIKYKFAYDNQSRLINIASLSKENKLLINDFTCIACGDKLVARLGEINTKHFAHKHEVTCSGETYLHALGKKLFYDEYNYCLQTCKPFYLSFTRNKICDSLENKHGLSCHLEDEEIDYDLTKSFQNILVEKQEGIFIPDLLLISEKSKEKIFIEVAVTHQSTLQKRSSSNKIIEFKVYDEADLNFIQKHRLAENDVVKFFNFNFKDNKKKHCTGSCVHKGFNLGIVFNEGKCLLRPNMTLSHAHNYISKIKDQVQYYELGKADEGSQGGYFKLIGRASKMGAKVKNCFICKYHALNEYRSIIYDDDGDKAIFCKFRKIKCTSNEAADCSYFRVSQEYVEKLSKDCKDD